MASALDPIFYEIHPVTRFDPLATCENIFGNFSEGFCLWDGSKPPVSCCHVSTILLGEYGHEPPRGCLLTILE